MRIPQEHILTLELCRIYKLKLGKFNDMMTNHVFGKHHPTLMDFMRTVSQESNECSIFGYGCKEKLKRLQDVFEEAYNDYTCSTFQQVQ